MSALQVRGLHKAYGRVVALTGVDLSVTEGCVVAVLGPSGCGKTTLLRCVAGFERLDAGEIRLGGKTIAAPGIHVPVHRRRVAVVPQEGALFPHLSVAGNVGYGLDRPARRAGRVEEILTLVGLSGYGDRMPHQLSGGQQQRVAVARALAPRPPLVLLDEPFSALDAGLRTDLRRDVLAAIHADGATAVLVTHDQAEALSIADQVTVMRAGRIVQTATPTALYRQPADPWVAGFVGEAVLLPAVVTNGKASTSLGQLPVDGDLSGPALVLLRPEQVQLDPDLTAPSTVAATVTRRDFHGHDTLLGLRLGDGTEIAARVFDSSSDLPAGAQVALRVHGTARAYHPPGGTARGVAAQPGEPTVSPMTSSSACTGQVRSPGHHRCCSPEDRRGQPAHRHRNPGPTPGPSGLIRRLPVRPGERFAGGG
jgi:iron(III) transport system ATP-binding protein